MGGSASREKLSTVAMHPVSLGRTKLQGYDSAIGKIRNGIGLLSYISLT